MPHRRVALPMAAAIPVPPDLRPGDDNEATPARRARALRRRERQAARRRRELAGREL